MFKIRTTNRENRTSIMGEFDTMEIIVQSNSLQETLVLGRKLAQVLRGGDVIGLTGDLGSGKTALVQGIGAGCGLPGPLTSPTFTFIQEYAVAVHGESCRLIHMDLYRLNYPEEAEVIGVPDFFQEDCICLIEWPKVVWDWLPENQLEVQVEGSGDTVRRFTFSSVDAEWMERLRPLQD